MNRIAGKIVWAGALLLLGCGNSSSPKADAAASGVGKASVGDAGPTDAVTAPVCIADEWSCFGADLRRCNAEMNSWVKVETCATPALCDSKSKSCRVCSKDDVKCLGNDLMTCNATRTGWDRVQTCADSVCDVATASCKKPAPVDAAARDAPIAFSADAAGDTSCGPGLVLDGTKCRGGLQEGAPWPISAGRANNDSTGVAVGAQRAPTMSEIKIFFTSDALMALPSIAADGTMLITTNQSELIALDRQGSVLWRLPLLVGAPTPPTIAADGTIYVNAGGKMYAVVPPRAGQRDPTIRWERDSPSRRQIWSHAAVTPDGMIVAGYDGGLFGMDPANGTMIWSQPFSLPGAQSSVAAPNGQIYLVNRFKLYAFTVASLVPRWVYTPSCTLPSNEDVDMSTPAVGLDGTIYYTTCAVSQQSAGCPPLGHCLLHAVTPDGQAKWPPVTFPNANTKFQGAAIGHDNSVYVTGSNVLCRVSPEGQKLWCKGTQGGGSLIDEAGNVYSSGASGDDPRTFSAVRPDGTDLFRMTMPADSLTNPIMGADGTLYIGYRRDAKGGVNLLAIPPLK